MRVFEEILKTSFERMFYYRSMFDLAVLFNCLSKLKPFSSC